MNFKDKNYYIKKAKEHFGMVLVAFLFDAFLIMMFLFNALR